MIKGIAIGVYLMIFAEIFLRLLAPQAIVPRYVTGAPWGVRGNIPHARYRHFTPEVTVEYRINGQGMRADRDFPFAKPEGACRIAVLGDSFFVGYELDLRDTFTTQIEEHLRAAGFQVEVLNFSVSGFGTAEMIRAYEGFARRFDPDVILFGWHMTDPDDNIRSGLYRLDGTRLRRANEQYLPGVRVQDALLRSAVYRKIADHSHLYAFARERIAISLKRVLLETRKYLRRGQSDDAETMEESIASVERPRDEDSRVKLSAALMLYARDLIESEGREHYVVEVPRRVSRTQFRSSIEVLPEDVRAQLHVISPLAALTAAARPDLKLFYEEGHGHFTPAGVQLLVREAQKLLKASPRLGACRAPSAARTQSTMAW